MIQIESKKPTPMPLNISERTVCPIHGSDRKRATCPTCNASYMRDYLKKVREEQPDLAMLERAKKRARRAGIPYSLGRGDIAIPASCPALGIPLVVGGGRSDNSPSLDRIDPRKGYQPGNVRVVSDRANRLKGNRSLAEVTSSSIRGPRHLRADHAAVAAYMEREALLVEVKLKAAQGGSLGREWTKVAAFLEQAFRHYPVIVGHC